MKLWKKGYNLHKEIEKFTVGTDHIIDLKLVKYDCIASIAHAKMLNKIDIISKQELEMLIKGLNDIIELNSKDNFKINLEDEDCHTAIENYLVKNFGEVGKKIHTGRSRNDQVLTAIRLYEKEELNNIKELLNELKGSLKIKIDKKGDIKIPGYTHMQKAMPNDIKTWLGCFFDAIIDNIKIIENCANIIDQSPLGSGAGFGIPLLKIDKNMTSDLMGFQKVMENSIYVQMSRGKFEAMILSSISQIMFDLNKLSTDLIMFNMPEFGFVELPEEFCTGSSIMPQKKNPDVLELIRANYSIILGEEFKIKSLISNLMSGYNRDLQLTKKPLFDSIDLVKDNIKIMSLVILNLKINKEKCESAMSKELFATEEAYKLVQKGYSFRDAYQKIARSYNDNSKQ
jgi:argininosuccinate lyase